MSGQRPVTTAITAEEEVDVFDYDKYEAMRSDPGVQAGVDQAMRVMTDACRLAPDNGHLSGDPYIAGCLEAIPSGIQTNAERRPRGTESRAPRPMVVLHDWTEIGSLYSAWRAAEVPADGGPVKRGEHARCWRCAPPVSLDGFAYGPYRTLWINKGETIAEFSFCLPCVAHYERTYGSVVWKTVSSA